MTRTPVQSSAIVSIGYEGGVLEVEYPGGRVYQHAGVPQEKYDELMAAESKGRAINALRAEYPGSRVEQG
jgi:hypothetical protein